MASMKAKKGNPFEKLIAYNLKLLGYEVQRIDDNTKGIDLIAKNGVNRYVIECKFHKRFSWNEIEKILDKTIKETDVKFGNTNDYLPIFIFKGNQQPILIAFKGNNRCMSIRTFQSWFYMGINKKIEKIPKGYKVWKD